MRRLVGLTREQLELRERVLEGLVTRALRQTVKTLTLRPLTAAGFWEDQPRDTEGQWVKSGSSALFAGLRETSVPSFDEQVAAEERLREVFEWKALKKDPHAPDLDARVTDVSLEGNGYRVLGTVAGEGKLDFFVGVRNGERIAKINDIVVPDYARGRGFGRKYVKRIEDELQRDGVKYVELLDLNTEGFWQGLGYEPTADNDMILRKQLDFNKSTLIAASEPSAISTTAAVSGATAATLPPLELASVPTTWQSYVTAELYPFLVETYLAAGQATAETVQETLGVLLPQLTQGAAEAYLTSAKNRLAGIGDDLWSQLRTQLAEGYSAGESTHQLAARIRQTAALTEPRALVIARTEVIPAANAASLEQVQLAFTDEECSKEWLSTNDLRTREAHRKADGQRVPIHRNFTVGGEALPYPGWPGGSPENVISCRCTLAFVFADDAGEDNGEDALVASLEEFHGNHDQRNHGNWARRKTSAPVTLDVPSLLQAESTEPVLKPTPDPNFQRDYDDVPIGVYTVKQSDEPIGDTGYTGKQVFRAWKHFHDNSYDINKRLRADEDLGEFTDDLDVINASFAESRTPRDYVTYRGVQKPGDVFDWWDDGDLTGRTWEDPALGYVSTNTQWAQMHGAGGNAVVLRVKLPRGTSVVAGNAVESELLLPPKTRYRVVKDHGVSGPTGQRVLDVEVIPSEPLTAAVARRERTWTPADESKHERDARGRFARKSGAVSVGKKLRLRDVIEADTRDDDAEIDPDTAAEIRDAFTGEFRGLRTGDVEVSRGHGRGSIKVSGTIFDSSGSDVGMFTRQLRPLKSGDIEAEHVTLLLNKDVQGQGFAHAFNGHLFDWYRENGVSRVRLLADSDVGGYAWARAGYDWQPDDVDGLLDMQNRIDLARRDGSGILRRVPAERREEQRRLAQRLYLDVADTVTEDTDPDDELPDVIELWPTPFELSQLGRWEGAGRDDWWIGKSIMMDSNWWGVRYLDDVDA